MCPEALGVALRVAKHLGTILTSLETVWDNLKKIEKNRFFPSNFLKSLAVLSFASGNFLTGEELFFFPRGCGFGYLNARMKVALK